jgi:hypothetical protein
VFDDVSTGKSLKDSVIQRVLETISKMVVNKNSQSGSGMRCKRIYERKKPVKRAKRDIFS